MLVREVANLIRLKARLPNEYGTAVLRVNVWINTIRVMTGMVDDVVRRMELGLDTIARYDACRAYEYVYSVLSREPDPIYLNLQRLIASLSVALQRVCKEGDERQRPLPRQ